MENPARDWGFMAMVFRSVSVQPLLEVKDKIEIKVEVEVEILGFSRVEVVRVLKFQWKEVVMGDDGLVPVKVNWMGVRLQARS